MLRNFAFAFAAVALATGCTMPTEPATSAQPTTSPNGNGVSSPTTVTERAPELENQRMDWEKIEVGGPPASQTPKGPAAKPTPPKGKWSIKGNVTLDAALSNPHVLMLGDGTVHLAIELAATKKAGTQRLPMNVALVIDRSGSMRGDKIRDTRRAARHFVEQLTDKDTIAIVSYSDDVRVDLPASPADGETRQAALDAITKIRAGGSTNLSGGLFRGQEEVQRGMRLNQINRVILMSDGLANRGITDTKALSQQAQKHAQQGISVTTMGVGVDYNEDLMTAVADHASGNYYFIKDSDQIVSVFTQELQKMFGTVAQGAVVEVLIEDGIDLKQVFGYTFTRKGDTVSIPLAELFAGQKRAILLALQVPTLREGKMAVSQVTLKYVDVASEGEARKAEVLAEVVVTKDKELVTSTRNKEVEERVGEVQVANAMNTAANLLRDGEADKAEAVLDGAFKANEGRASAMGGSVRLQRQSTRLRKLSQKFRAAKTAPAAAAEAVKSTKESGRALAR